MEEKPGGGLRMSEIMRDAGRDWLDNFDANYRMKTAEAEKKRAEQERQDATYWTKKDVERKAADIVYAAKAERVWENLQTEAKKRPISDERWEGIKRRAGMPSMGEEMTYARAEAEAEATSPVDRGIFGLGILSSIRKLVLQEIEQSEKRREAARVLNRAAIF
jgi:hypothetical protein